MGVATAPLVGRAEELALLDGAVAELTRGEWKAVELVGEPVRAVGERRDRGAHAALAVGDEFVEHGPGRRERSQPLRAEPVGARLRVKVTAPFFRRTGCRDDDRFDIR